MIDRRIQVLRAVDAHGTVTAAAHVLGYTPSAVSYQLRALARELGIELLEPDGRRIRLTPAAHLLLARADELSARWEQIRAELASDGVDRAGTLTLCGFSTAAAALLPAAVAAVTAAHPHVVTKIIEASPEECFDLLLTEHADVAVVVATSATPPRGDRRFAQDSLVDDRLDLLVPTGHRLATLDSVALEDAAAERWIMDRPGSTYRQLVLAACAAAGFTPEIAHESIEWDTGAALVGAGLGVAMIPRLARLPTDPRVTRVPLRGEPAPARHILTVVRRGSAARPVVATALTALRVAAADVAEQEQEGTTRRSVADAGPTDR